MEDKKLPMHHVSSLNTTEVVEETLLGTCVIAGITKMTLNAILDCLWNSGTRFILRVYS